MMSQALWWVFRRVEDWRLSKSRTPALHEFPLSLGRQRRGRKTFSGHIKAATEELAQRLHDELVMQINHGVPGVQGSLQKIMRSELGLADQERKWPPSRKKAKSRSKEAKTPLRQMR